MPRRSKGARLWLRPAEWSGRQIVRAATFFILDGNRQIRTGCAAGEVAAAQAALADYIKAKHEPSRRERDIEAIAIADVLAIFHENNRERQSNPIQFDRRIERLNEFSGRRNSLTSTAGSASLRAVARL